MIIHYTPTGVLNNSPNHNANEKGPLEQNYLLELGGMRSQNWIPFHQDSTNPNLFPQTPLLLKFN